MKERTLSIIKPDGIEKKNVGKIISLLENIGLKLIAIKLKQLTVDEAMGFYDEHNQRPFFKGLVAYMTRGPVVLIVLEGDNAIEKYRNLMGQTDPEKASEGTIRKQFATSIQENTVHGSDSAQSAEREIEYFFADLV